MNSWIGRALQEPRPTTINRASRRFSGPRRYFTEWHERQCGHSFHWLGRRSTSPATCECALEELDQRGIALHSNKGNHAHFLDRYLLGLFDELLFEVFPGVGDGKAVVVLNYIETVFLHRTRYRRSFEIPEEFGAAVKYGTAEYQLLRHQVVEDSQTLRRGLGANQNLVVLHIHSLFFGYSQFRGDHEVVPVWRDHIAGHRL